MSTNTLFTYTQKTCRVKKKEMNKIKRFLKTTLA